jgi:hypothetical protein
VGNQQRQECVHLPLCNLKGSDDHELSHFVVARQRTAN